MTRLPRVILIPLKFPLVRMGQNLGDIVIRSLQDQAVTLKRGDVVATASKVVSLCEGRIVQLGSARVPPRVKGLSRRWKINEHLLAIVSAEADNILGGLDRFLLTVKNGILTANAGVDSKNSPPGTVVLWPRRPDKSAQVLRKRLEREFHIKIGVVIVDSRITPLRLGTTGLAIGVSGFRPLSDDRRKSDLYGRRVRVTQSNVADDLAAAAHMLMGERRERVGAVVIRNAVTGVGKPGNSRALKLNPSRCLFVGGLNAHHRLNVA